MATDGDPGPTPFPTTEQLRRINREFVALVRSWFPRKFYGRTAQHQAFVGAALLRMCDTLDDLMLLMTHPGSGDQGARVLLRSLYEQAIRLSWVLIDQQAHHFEWVGHAQNELLTIHNCLLPFGETYLSAALLANVRGAKDMPPVEQMTREADRYWAPKVPGLHPRAKPKKQQPNKRPGHAVPDTPEHPTDSEPMLSFEGLYQTIYRTTSHSVHGSLNSLEGYVDLEGPWPVARRSEERLMVVYALGAPVLGIALMVAGQRFPWIDQDRVRRFVDRASAETIRRREGRDVGATRGRTARARR